MAIENKNVLGREGTEAQMRTRLSAGQMGKATDNNKLVHKSRVLDTGVNIVTTYLSEAETLALINSGGNGSVYWGDPVENFVDLPGGDPFGTVRLVTSERVLYTINIVNNWQPLGGDLDVVDSTGVLTGGILATGTGATEFSISNGTGQIVTTAGVKTEVTWTGITNITPTNIASTARTYIAIDNAGLLVQSSTDFTVDQSRTLIILGIVVHLDQVNVNAVNNQQHIAFNAMSTTYDLAEAIGIFNVSGNLFSGNGANLNMDKTVGKLFRAGTNYENDINNPHEPTSASTAQQSFTYVYSDNSPGVTGIAVDPANLDDGAGGLTALSNNTKWSVQRIYLFTSGIVAVQRGVAEFNSLDDAINGIDGEAYSIASELAPNALLRGWLVARKDATDLTDITKAKFIEAPKFGAGGGASGGSPSLVDLQTAYNNSVSPEILTDATRGALTLKNGQLEDTDKVLEIANIAGTITASVDGDGCGRLTTLDVIHEATASDDHALEIDANANGFGDVKALDIDYITGAIATGDDEAAILVNIDKFASTGGDIVALEVLSTSGGATTTAILAGADVGVIEQTSGTFGDMASALNNAVDVLTEFTTIGSDVQMFVADNDTVTIGNLAKFEEIEFILAIVASQNINPTFEYSTGIGTWGTFTPIDGTNGMKNTGLVAWLDSDIPSWAVGTASEFLIRITRTRNGLSTPPTESLVQIAETTEFFWDKDGDVKINALEVVGAGAFGSAITVDTPNSFPLVLISSGSNFLRQEGDGNVGWIGKNLLGQNRFLLNSLSGTNNLALSLYDATGANNESVFKATYQDSFEIFYDTKVTAKILQGNASPSTEGIVCESLKAEGIGTFEGSLGSVEIGGAPNSTADEGNTIKYTRNSTNYLNYKSGGASAVLSIGGTSSEIALYLYADLSAKFFNGLEVTGGLKGDSYTTEKSFSNSQAGMIAVNNGAVGTAERAWNIQGNLSDGLDFYFYNGTAWIKYYQFGSDGKLTTSGEAEFQGTVTMGDLKLSALNTAPSSATDTGVLGEIRYTADYMYVCTATNTWKRSALATW